MAKKHKNKWVNLGGPNPIGWCAYHKSTITLQQMRTKRCLQKGCHALQPNRKDERWIQIEREMLIKKLIRRRSKKLGRRLTDSEVRQVKKSIRGYKGVTMVEYLKIETPFVRAEDGTKKLIEGQFRNETVEYLKDNQWEWTEKVDGTNISIVWDGYKVQIHGRTERAQIPSHLFNKLSEMFLGDVNEELFEQTFGENTVILYGEGYGNKIQSNGYIENGVSFILFDVYFPNKNIWLKRDAVEDIAQKFNVDIVPIILTGTIDEAVAFVKQKPVSVVSEYLKVMEGLVGRPKVEVLDRNGKRIILKVKVKDFD